MKLALILFAEDY